MIREQDIKDLLENKLVESDIFLVGVHIGTGSQVRVLVDSMDGVTIKECVDISRWLQQKLDEQEENYSLEVSSPGLDAPLVMKQQYLKNRGREVEVVLKDGKKMKGKLIGVMENGIELEVIEKALGEGSQKKKNEVPVNKKVVFEEIKTTRVIISF